MFTRTTTAPTHPLGAYADASGDETINLEFPEDFTAVSDEDLNALHDRAVETFNGLYGDGSDLTEDDVNALASLTEGIEAVQTEKSARHEAAQERSARAAELAAKVRPEPAEGEQLSAEIDPDEDEKPEGEDGEDEEEPDAEEDESPEDRPEGAGDTVTASAKNRAARREVRVPVSRTRRHMPKAEASAGQASTMADVAFAAGEGTGYAPGTGIDWMGAASIIEKRLRAFNQGSYQAANRAGKHMRQQMSVMGIRKPIEDDLVIKDESFSHVNEVLTRATQETRLPGNSLVASGGWCAPSETLYDLLEMESRDGIFSLPEVGVTRGGIRRTLGPDFADIYSAITGFHYTEDQDIAGQYGVGADGVGNDTDGEKPCYKIECPEFEDFRLDVIGLCLTAGLLQQRGYPEVIARTIRGALVAHDHRIAAKTLAEIESQSTAVTMGAVSGAAAPILQAIELQVEHLRYTSRIARSTTIEGVFPYWVRGAVRADLADRNGVDLLNVSDAQIDAWFSLRGIAPQFVYNWQDVNTLGADEFIGWPDEVKFLLYPAGTWIRGSSDIITVDTLFDSTQLRSNDYTALFTEEGWMVVRMGHYSRVVTVPINASGVSGEQIDLSGPTVDLTPAPPVEG